jgi:hypothetical protein
MVIWAPNWPPSVQSVIGAEQLEHFITLWYQAAFAVRMADFTAALRDVS